MAKRNIKPITRNFVTSAVCNICVHAELDQTPVRGNALASGDDADDRAQEDEIIDRVNGGDDWAWAAVTVVVTDPVSGLSEREHLGCCTYKDEADFRSDDGYFKDMVGECVDRINDRIRKIIAAYT